MCYIFIKCVDKESSVFPACREKRSWAEIRFTKGLREVHFGAVLLKLMWVGSYRGRRVKAKKSVPLVAENQGGTAEVCFRPFVGRRLFYFVIKI